MPSGTQIIRLHGLLLSRKPLYRERGQSKLIFYLMMTGRKYEVHAEGAQAELMQTAKNGDRMTVLGYPKRQGWQPTMVSVICATDILFE